MRHGDGKGQRATTPSPGLGLELDHELRLRRHPAAGEGVVGAKPSLRHCPDVAFRLAHRLQGHALANGIDRHEPELPDFHSLDPVLDVSRESMGRKQHRKIIAPHRHLLVPEFHAEQVPGQILRHLRAALPIIGNDFDDPGGGLIGHSGLEDGPISAAHQFALVESELIVRQALAVNRDLNQIAVLAFEGRTDAFENVDMNIPRREPLAQDRLERVERHLVAAEVQVRFADEAVPAPPAAALIGETDLFRVAKPVQIVDEQPHGAGIAIFELVEDLSVADNTVERRLTRDIGHGAKISLIFVTKRQADAIRLAVPVVGMSGWRLSRNSRFRDAVTKFIRWLKSRFASAALMVAGSSPSNISRTITLRTPSASMGSPAVPSIRRVLPEEDPVNSILSIASISPSRSRVPHSGSNARSATGTSVSACPDLSEASSSELKS